MREREMTLIEGAGGLWVPLDLKGESVADLWKSLDLPLILVAHDALGVLSHAIALLRSLGIYPRSPECRGELRPPIAALILSRHGASGKLAADSSSADNAVILRELFPSLPLFRFAACVDDDEQLSRVAETSGLIAHLLDFAPS